MNELTKSEQSKLCELEKVVETHLRSFMAVGNALTEIRDNGLYRKNYDTFEDYCQDRWDISRPRAYQLIDAAQVEENLSTMVLTQPANERQIRPLTQLEPELQREAWAKAVETAPEGRVTSQHVREVVNEMKEEEIEKAIKKDQELINKEEMISPKFEETFRAFYMEVQIAKMDKWKETSQEAALKCLKITEDLIIIH